MHYEAMIMDARREARAEAYAEGCAEAILEFVKNLLSEGFPAEQIFKLSNCTQEQLLQARRELDAEKIFVDNNQQT